MYHNNNEVRFSKGIVEIKVKKDEVINEVHALLY